MEKRFGGLENLTLEIPDVDSHNVGVDQASNFGFAFFEIAVEMGILQGDRRQRSQQFQQRYPSWSKDVGSQIIFEVEQTDHFGMVNQRQAENRTGVPLTDIEIRGK